MAPKKRLNAYKSSSSTPEIPRWEEEQDVGNCNPDKLFLCPYDPNHHIRACRMPYHLIKCMKNHPQLADELLTCPFNARHLMPKSELSHHMSTCASRCSINTDYAEAPEWHCKFQVPVNNWTPPICDEDWDQEVQEVTAATAPFVWCTLSSQLIQDRTNRSTEQGLTPSVRAPRVLPWKLGQ